MNVEAVATWLFGIAAAVWVVTQFLLRRESAPGAELELHVDFVARQQGQFLIEISATLANRGFVQQRYGDFRLVVRYLMPDDPIADGGERLFHQVRFPHTIDERIGGARRIFANAQYIDPRLTFRHSYVTFIPADATCVLVQGSLKFSGFLSSKKQTKNAQRLLRVPLPAPPAIPIESFPRECAPIRPSRIGECELPARPGETS